MDGRNNEIQNQSLQQGDLIDQLSNANEEIMSLRSENKRIRNDLNSKRQINERSRNDLSSEKQINERMIKSHAYMNQLNEKSHFRQKGKERIGYTKEGESSKQGAQKNQRPICNHYGNLGHTSNKY